MSGPDRVAAEHGHDRTEVGHDERIADAQKRHLSDPEASAVAHVEGVERRAQRHDLVGSENIAFLEDDRMVAEVRAIACWIRMVEAPEPVDVAAVRNTYRRAVEAP